MLPNILDSLIRRRGEDSAPLPEAEAPSAVPEMAADKSQARMAAIRETIDQIEIDLAAMIRDVQHASDAVRGTRTTADVLVEFTALDADAESALHERLSAIRADKPHLVLG